MTRPFAIVLTLAGIVSVTATHQASAQYVIRRGAMQPSATYSVSPPSGAQAARTYSYSYYTLSPLPARTYVGYGSTDFPYHGAPYGHPYDPWTWPMMSGSYGNGLARYYDPPVK